MDDAQKIFDALCAPFPSGEVMWRVGRTNAQWRKEGEALEGQAVAYIDARTVMDRLDAVVGADNWQNTYTPGVGASIVCNIGIRFKNEAYDEWLWKADGAGPSDMEADKGALSDAFKRAGVRWGIARYLYDMKVKHWLVLEQRGKTAVISKADLARLDNYHDEYVRRRLPHETGRSVQPPGGQPA